MPLIQILISLKRWALALARLLKFPQLFNLLLRVMDRLLQMAESISLLLKSSLKRSPSSEPASIRQELLQRSPKKSEARAMISRDDYRAYLLRFVGVPYIWGGSSPIEGLDCSGFVQIALTHLEIDPYGDQTAQALFCYFEPRSTGVHGGESDLGDLLFFGHSPDRVTHVAIALDGTEMIEAAHGDSTCTTVEIAQAKGAKVMVTKQDRRPDLVAILRPLGLAFSPR